MTSSQPKVSVLMPAYNSEKYVSEAIESILKQTFTEYEFLIIDDGSKDKTWEIIQEYAKKDRRITATKNDKNLGISSTRNKLTLHAKGKYVVWQDADDISMEYRIDHQFKYMEENPEIGISGGYLQFFDERGDLSIRKYPSEDRILRKKIFRYSPCPQPAAIIRRECFEVTGYFPMNSPVAEDLAMSFQIGTEYKFGNLEEVLIKYRQVKSGATFSKLRIIELYTIFLRYLYDGNGFQMTFADRVYNFVQYLSVFLIPTKLKIKIFNLLRNSR
jgi:glycosyltransferase involved in cell wall biosynthesis